MQTPEEIEKVIQWYWREIQQKPYQTTAAEVANEYRKDTMNIEFLKNYSNPFIYELKVDCEKVAVFGLSSASSDDEAKICISEALKSLYDLNYPKEEIEFNCI